MFNLIYLLLFFSSQAEWREVNDLMNASSNTRDSLIVLKHAMDKLNTHLASLSFNSNFGDLTKNILHLILIHLLGYWW